MRLGIASNLVRRLLPTPRRRWSSRKLSERAAIIAIGLVALCALAVGVVVVIVQTGLVVPHDPVAEQRRSSLQGFIDRELHTGDPTERIVTFLTNHALTYEYDSANRRYVAGVYRSTDGAHYVMVTLWVDSHGRYMRGEATDVLTFL